MFLLSLLLLLFCPGVIYTTRELVFNANQPAVHLVVTATDDGTPVRQSTAITVQITVEDVNDHAPVFSLDSYRLQCTLPSAFLSTAGSVRAPGHNGSLI